MRFRVPLLFLGPGIRETYGAINHTVATQTDIVPMVVGLLGKPFVHQCWGRNLLSLEDNDPGMGVVKPSGSDQTLALIRGEQLLIKPPKGKELLGHYAFYPDEFYRQENDDQLNEDLSSKLAAFIQSAIQSLRGNRTGIPREQAH